MRTKLLTLILCITPVFILAQNYEKEGDDLFSQGQYEAAYKKYTAYIAIVGESSSVSQKQTKCTKCKNLLTQAKNAEQSAQNTNSVSKYEEASQAYNKLYETHPLQTYKSKANLMKQKADNILADIQREEQAERERQAREEEERKRQEQIKTIQNYINNGDNNFKSGAYQQAVENYKKAIKLQGQNVTEALKTKCSNAEKCLQIYNKAKSAETNQEYDLAIQYYNNLYSINNLADYQSKVNKLQQKKQQEAQRRKQQQEEERQRAQAQADKERIEQNINNAQNTFTLQQLIEHPLGLANKDWDDYSKSSTLIALIKRYPDFKNSPKDDAKYKQESHTVEVKYVTGPRRQDAAVSSQGNRLSAAVTNPVYDYIMEGKVSDVIVFAPLTYARMVYKDKENGSYINREVSVKYKYTCSSNTFAEALVNKLTSEAQKNGYMTNKSTSYTYNTTSKSSKYDLNIYQQGNIVTISYTIKVQIRTPF